MARTKADCNTKAAVKAPRKVTALTGRAPNVKATKASKYSGGNVYCPRSTPGWQKPITSFLSKDSLGEGSSSMSPPPPMECSSSRAKEVKPADVACDEDPESSGSNDGGISDPSNEEPNAPSQNDDEKNDASKYSGCNAYCPRSTPDWQKPITSFLSKDSLGEGSSSMSPPPPMECSSSTAEEVKPADVACDEDPKSSSSNDSGISDPSNEEGKKSPSRDDDEKNDGEEQSSSDDDLPHTDKGKFQYLRLKCPSRNCPILSYDDLPDTDEEMFNM